MCFKVVRTLWVKVDNIYIVGLGRVLLQMISKFILDLDVGLCSGWSRNPIRYSEDIGYQSMGSSQYSRGVLKP